jgi:segregation and condensation protein B
MGDWNSANGDAFPSQSGGWGHSPWQGGGGWPDAEPDKIGPRVAGPSAIGGDSLDDAPVGPVASRRSSKMARLEAVLLVADVPLPPRKLATFASLADATEARTLMARLNRVYDQSGTPFRVERVAAGYRLLTRPEYATWLGKLHQREAELKLSPVALETLAIIAYRQPMTRADVEVVRGVQCSEMIKQLMDRGLVRIGGEEDSLGRPFLYETTRKFLELFGLQDLTDLPNAERLRKVPAPPVTTPAE